MAFVLYAYDNYPALHAPWHLSTNKFAKVSLELCKADEQPTQNIGSLKRETTTATSFGLLKRAVDMILNTNACHQRVRGLPLKYQLGEQKQLGDIGGGLGQ